LVIAAVPSSSTPAITKKRVAPPWSLKPAMNGMAIRAIPTPRSIMKCVRSGISFTSEMRQRVDMPVSSTTTPTITLSVVAVSLSLNPKIHGAAISRRAATGSIA
jgi:hypothetical protein